MSADNFFLILALLAVLALGSGCRTNDRTADGPDTTQKFDEREGYNFGTGAR